MTAAESLVPLARIASETAHLLRWSVSYSPDCGVGIIAWERDADLGNETTEPVVNEHGYDTLPTVSPDHVLANVRAYLAARFGYTDLAG